jgi:hypothetical protein
MTIKLNFNEVIIPIKNLCVRVCRKTLLMPARGHWPADSHHVTGPGPAGLPRSTSFHGCFGFDWVNSAFAFVPTGPGTPGDAPAAGPVIRTQLGAAPQCWLPAASARMTRILCLYMIPFGVRYMWSVQDSSDSDMLAQS